MTDATIGIVGTLAGTVMGFGLIWIKEFFDEKKAIKVRIEALDVSIKSNAFYGPYEYGFKGSLLLSNRSTIKQPIWGIQLAVKTDTGMHGIKFQEFSNEGGKPFPYMPIGHINIEPKSTVALPFEWSMGSQIKPTDFKKGSFILVYKTFNGEKRIQVKPGILNLCKTD